MSLWSVRDIYKFFPCLLWRSQISFCTRSYSDKLSHTRKHKWGYLTRNKSWHTYLFTTNSLLTTDTLGVVFSFIFNLTRNLRLSNCVLLNTFVFVSRICIQKKLLLKRWATVTNMGQSNWATIFSKKGQGRKQNNRAWLISLCHRHIAFHLGLFKCRIQIQISK